MSATAFAIFFMYVFFIVFVEVYKEPEVTLDIGQVQGRTSPVLKLDVFYGIPYAKPPVGHLRFRKPEPMPPSSRILDARNMRYPCVQGSYFAFHRTLIETGNASEDCLHLNIYAPQRSEEVAGTRGGVLSPVFVLLLGWDFGHGSNSYSFADASRFADKARAVVVVPNYRLGAFGFMRSEQQKSPGNMGLLDQALMLRWVRDNIPSFGGNPHNVVLLGQGTGGTTAGYNLLSPMTRGFTRRAILHSGSPLMPFPEERGDPIEGTARGLHCPHLGQRQDVDPVSLVQCIHRTPTGRLRDALEGKFYPVYGDAYLPDKFSGLMSASGDTAGTVLVGNVQNEGDLLVAHEFRNLTEKELSTDSLGDIEARLLTYLQGYRVPNLTTIVRRYYEELRHAAGHVTFFRLAADLLGDMLFVCPMQLYADIYSAAGNDVYYFLFRYKPSTTLLPAGNLVGGGATQMDDLAVLFGVGLDNMDEENFFEVMAGIWARFGKNGDLPVIANKSWPRYTGSRPNYVLLDHNHMSITTKYRDIYCDMWRPYLKSR
ncbi:unnamed protein product [Ixodes pacificus]